SRRARTAGSAAPGTWSFPTACGALGPRPAPPGVLTRLGASLPDGLQILGEATRLFFATVRAAAFAPAARQRVVVQMVRVGTDTLFIGALLSLFVGMVMVVQAADQVREVSQDILGPIVGLAMTKELGPVLMAFLLAGRAGSAMAAELGSMTVYDEINALRTMDIDPVRFLVMPRFVAATIALPVLVLYRHFIGVGGGAGGGGRARERRPGRAGRGTEGVRRARRARRHRSPRRTRGAARHRRAERHGEVGAAAPDRRSRAAGRGPHHAGRDRAGRVPRPPA